MKKKLLFPLSILALLTMTGCTFNLNNSASSSSSIVSSNNVTNSSEVVSTTESTSEVTYSSETYSSEVITTETTTSEEVSSEDYGTDYQYNSSIIVNDPTSIVIEENDGEFSISTEDGYFVKTNNIYTITTAGTYQLSGNLEGQILIEAREEDEVILELNDVSISYDQDSPIKALSGDKVEISALKNTSNSIDDTRNHKSVDSESQGEGAISADIDLKLKGSGTLVVSGNYNNAVHTTKDLVIQKLTLQATGYNNALKGKDSVTINSGTIQAYALTGNGIKTEDSDISSKGTQRGTIAVNGGNVYVDSLHDALDASYNIVIDETDSEVTTSLTIKTGTYSTSYNRSSFKADSEKGIKAANEIIVNKGTITISASDDAIHANYGDTLDNGNIGLGNITVNDGTIQVASGDDGLHADNTLSIAGGKVIVTGATEGYEANYINISGGSSYIYGTDDGVNCSKKTFNNCSFTMSGGYLDVAVRSGDTDGIDSNGNFTLTGGVIVTRGSPGTSSNMSTGLDVDGTISMTGGTLIAFNGLERSPSTSSTIHYAGTMNNTSMGGFPGGGGRPGQQSSSSSSSLSAGNYVLTLDGVTISFTNDYVYGSFMVYSSYLTTGKTYTLTRNNSTVYSWNQSSTSVTIS